MSLPHSGGRGRLQDGNGVGYAEKDRDKTVTPVAMYGYEKKNVILKRLNSLGKIPRRGRGSYGTCIRTGIPSIIRSVGSQAEYCTLESRGIKAWLCIVIGLPLFLDGRKLGALTIYSSETDAFDTEEIEFSSNYPAILSYGIGVLRLRKAQMQAEKLLKEANLDLERRVRNILPNWLKSTEELLIR